MAVVRTISLRQALACAVVGGAVLLCGCGDGDGLANAPAHPWVRPPPGLDEHAVVLPAWLIHRVAPAVLDEAVEELENEPYVQISPGMAAYYTQTDMQVPAEVRPFLVRGLDAGNSDIVVTQSRLGLWIKAVGGDGAAVHPQPLIVLSDPTPVEIFVTVEPGG